MAIIFTCKHCGKRIEAPEKTRSRRVKCPGCKKGITVPDNKQQDAHSDNTLKLAPLDQNEEAKRKHLLSETFNLTQTILQERSEPADSDDSIPPMDSPFFEPPAEAIDIEELHNIISKYLRLMADGELNQASQLVHMIASKGQSSITIIDKIAVNDMPEPELDGIPPQVLSGLIRNLRSKIN